MKMAFRKVLSAFWPHFWRDNPWASPYQTFVSYRRVWFLSVIILGMASLLPLSILAIIDSRLNSRAVRVEQNLHTVRLTSNLRRSVTFFLHERLDALTFTVHEETFQTLKDSAHLANVLKNLKAGFGGVSDLGVIDSSGNQIAYSGPFELTGRNYSDQDWFKKCRDNGTYISEVFMGYRNIPHIIIAVKSYLEDGSFFILRATLDTALLIDVLTPSPGETSIDSFLINHSGIIQTPSNHFGDRFTKIDLPVPEYSDHTSSFEAIDNKKDHLVIGYAYIMNSPYILLLVRHKIELMKTWINLRTNHIVLLETSLVVILITIYLISTFMVNKIYESDKLKARTMIKMENTSRLVSIGRLAAGVAHEINNPLAVINEEAGLIKDMIMIEKKYPYEEDLMTHIESILESVDRCGSITQQLLGFARHVDVKIKPVNLERVVREVINFLRTEALLRNIQINVQIPEDFQEILTDRGKLLQILLNLVNNGFQAMENGGKLDISAHISKDNTVAIDVSDTGCGIPEKDLVKVFDPFFTTKALSGGTGLGLSITYGLVKKLEGTITVSSIVGKGTTFTISLPLSIKEVKEYESPPG